ncbi:MAG: HDIG domain-containing protein [Candidatus Sericytochromatia bacterium]
MAIIEDESQSLEALKNIKPTENTKSTFINSPIFHKILIFSVTLLGIFLTYTIIPSESSKISKSNPLAYIGLSIYVLSLVSLFSVYLNKFWSTYFASTRHLALISTLTISTFLLNVLSLSFSPYFSFLPSLAMLARIFTNFQISLILSITATISTYMFITADITVLAINLFSVIISIFSLTKIQQRADLVKSGVLISAVNILLIASTKLMTNPTVDINHFFNNIAWGAGTGIFSAVYSIGALPFLESIFGLVTSFKLFELANPNQPLLRQLMLKAPGTYQHSLIVGNLAESAAEAINADPLLTRVGAMYHDVGKMIRPYFFIENQQGLENQHSKISPRLSALVITSHVKEGIELAKEYKLPNIIIDFIPMHHGTSLVAYFYHQAKQTEKPEDVIEEHFRYPGPKPRTKETAILMLADACEAAVRAISKPTVEQIQKTISKIIKARLDDGQLSEAPLTLVDLDRIGTEFLRILQSLYHSRIEYPSEEKIIKDLGKKITNGNTFK